MPWLPSDAFLEILADNYSNLTQINERHVDPCDLTTCGHPTLTNPEGRQVEGGIEVGELHLSFTMRKRTVDEYSKICAGILASENSERSCQTRFDCADPVVA